MKVRPVPVVLFALIACVAVSTPALAVTTVSRSGTTVTITGGDEANFLDQLTSGSLDPLRYRDADGLNFGAGCVDVGDFTIECGQVDPGLVVNVSLGGGNGTFRPVDSFSSSTVIVADLGPGDDTMNGSALNDAITGGPGADSINGRRGAGHHRRRRG